MVTTVNATSTTTLLTLPEVARRSGLSYRWVYILARRGDFPTERFGNYHMVSEADFLHWMATR